MVTVAIRNLAEKDLAAAVDLSVTAGWNQTVADWSRLLKFQPDGCFVAEHGGRIVGTVTTTRYGNALAWIGMMLVHPDVRRQGIATRLLETAIDFLHTQQVRCIKLDATPSGRPVYERLGFRTEWSFHRWQARRGEHHQPAASRSGRDRIADRWAELAPIDRAAFGVDRSDWVQRLAADCWLYVTHNGYGMRRPGRLAQYIGPVIADNPQSAAEIIDRLLAELVSDATVFWDVPQPNAAAVAMAERFGFEPVRDLQRMRFGPPLTEGLRLDYQYALSDPGTG